jgi:nicotinate phosphoribosyltransferase
LHSIADGILYTDHYQLTMAQLYWRRGIAETPVQFDHFFRANPDYGEHQAGYCINAGMEWLVRWMATARFGQAELEVLRAQSTSGGAPLFDAGFLEWLGEHGHFDAISLRAIPEGRVVHPRVPLTVVRGPLAMAQILETSLLNHLNYQTLIATKAARVAAAGRGRPVLEFGMRRGPERGSNAGARAALIGGADFTSNEGASAVVGIAPKGTHAHSMVQVFLTRGDGELEAFRAFAEAYPDDCLLLVDTVDTLGSGVPNAIVVFDELRAKGHEPVGIRLDSGDLAYLAIQAAKMLNDAGFADTTIVLSSSLDELAIWQILTQIDEEAPGYGVDPTRLVNRLSYGVGTRLITSEGAPSLDGVYKATALYEAGEWRPMMKGSESSEKITVPADKEAWRIYDARGTASVDLLTLRSEDPSAATTLALHHPVVDGVSREIDQDDISTIEPLLADVMVDGEAVGGFPDLEELRRRRSIDLEKLDPGVRRLINPHVYHVSLSDELYRLKRELLGRLG